MKRYELPRHRRHVLCFDLLWHVVPCIAVLCRAGWAMWMVTPTLCPSPRSWQLL